MTREDIEHLAQVTHSLHGCVANDAGNFRPFTQDEFDRLVDRMLWAIHASHDNPHFDETKFRQACLGTDGLKVF